MATVTIPEEEYARLKKLDNVDRELVRKFKNSLDDVENGRIKRVRYN